MESLIVSEILNFNPEMIIRSMGNEVRLSESKITCTLLEITVRLRTHSER